MSIRKRIVISAVASTVLTAIGYTLVEVGGWGPCGPASPLATVGGYLSLGHAWLLSYLFPGLGGAAARAGVPDWLWLALPWFDWFFAALLASMLWSLVMPLRHAQRRPGFCRNCGYNLTGNVSGRCPECGCKVADAGEPV